MATMEPLPHNSNSKCLKTLLGFGKQTDFNTMTFCAVAVFGLLTKLVGTGGVLEY